MQRDSLRRLVSGVTTFMLVVAAPAAAQILERPASRLEPRMWISATAGVMEHANASVRQSVMTRIMNTKTF